MSPPPSGPWLALDVGGANLKLAHEAGPALSVPFELWRRRPELTGVLAGLVRRMPPFGRVALTMTAELCDCYATKAEGVRDVLEATRAATDGRPLFVWCIDARFRGPDEVSAAPELAAAANWLALAEASARLLPTPTGLLIDVGSTTTDLIPLAGGRPRPSGLDDTSRLRTGELVYAGIRRTPLCALATEVRFRGRPTGLAAEVFATTLDVYLALGLIPPDPADLSTADGRPATPEASLGRLARTVAADRASFGPADALELALAFDAALLARLEDAARLALAVCSRRPGSVVLAGSGEALARRLARRLVPSTSPLISLGLAWGTVGAEVGCARALLSLVPET